MGHAAGEQAPRGFLRSGDAWHADALALAANAILTSLLGFAYWLVAAHLYNQAEVGIATSAVAGVTAVSALAQLNYNRSLAAVLPRRPADGQQIVRRTYLRTSVAAGLLGVGAVVVASLTHRLTSFSAPLPLVALGMAVAVLLWNVFAIEDTILASTGRAKIVPLENALYGVFKLALLAAVAYIGAGGIGALLLSWFLPLAPVVLAVNWYLFRRVLSFGRERRSLIADDLGRIGRSSRYDYVGSLVQWAGSLPLPVAVLLILGPRSAASFYLPQTLAAAVDVLALGIGTVLTARMSSRRGRMEHHDKLLILATVLCILVGSIALAPLAGVAQGFFGHGYATEGAAVLSLYILGAGPRTLAILGAAVARARGDGGVLLLLQLVMTLGPVCVGLPLLHADGLTAMGWGYLGADVLSAVLTVGYVRRVGRQKGK